MSEQETGDFVGAMKALENAAGESTQYLAQISQGILEMANIQQEYPLTCNQLEDLGMWNTAGCCSSCHEDVDYGYLLCEHILPDGRRILVCCRCEPWNPETEEDLELT